MKETLFQRQIWTVSTTFQTLFSDNLKNGERVVQKGEIWTNFLFFQ